MATISITASSTQTSKTGATRTRGDTMQQITLEDVWQEVKTKAWDHGLRSRLPWHDIEDLCSLLHFQIWVRFENGAFRDWEQGHIVGYVLRFWVCRVIDHIRSATRRQRVAVNFELVQELRDYREKESTRSLVEQLEVLSKQLSMDARVVPMLSEGHTQQEVAASIGVSKATLSRQMKRLRAEYRLIDVQVAGQTIEGGGVMTEVMKVVKKKKKIVVAQQQEMVVAPVEAGVLIVQKERFGRYAVLNTANALVAKVATKDGKVCAVVVDDKTVSDDAIRSAVVAFQAAETEAAAEAEAAAGPKPKNAGFRKAVTVQKTKKTTKKKAAVQEMPNDPILKKHIKKIGGLGKCQCGCGSNVARRFLPGHDAKLKAVLLANRTDSNVALIKAYGWAKYLTKKVAPPMPKKVKKA